MTLTETNASPLRLSGNSEGHFIKESSPEPPQTPDCHSFDPSTVVLETGIWSLARMRASAHGARALITHSNGSGYLEVVTLFSQNRLRNIHRG